MIHDFFLLWRQQKINHQQKRKYHLFLALLFFVFYMQKKKYSIFKITKLLLRGYSL